MTRIRPKSSRRLGIKPVSPSRVFRDPADVVAAGDMNRATKILMLSNWESSLRELLTACGTDPENDRPLHLGFMQARVLEALAAMNAFRPGRILPRHAQA